MLTIISSFFFIVLLCQGPQVPFWLPPAVLVVGLALDEVAQLLGFYRFLGFKNPLPLREPAAYKQ